MLNFDSYKECKDELFSLLKVVRFLEENKESNGDVYSALCNGNIIILGTLFESFTENIIQEYIDKLTISFNNRNIIYKELPQGIREYISKKVVNIHHKKTFESIHHGQAIKLVTSFLSGLEYDGFILDKELDGINKFSFGKHGENEIKKTFNRIGVDLCEISADFDDLNNFFNLRNGIVHSDRVGMTKGTLPDPNEIRKYILLLYLYIKSVNRCLNEKLTNSSSGRAKASRLLQKAAK